ncbi:MAG: beta-eliminating lyase-related protein [Azospirillaceae bacterium]
MWNFASDNVTGAAPVILQRLNEGMAGSVPAYGDDAVSQALEDRFAELFGCAVAVAPVTTGSAANALALSVLTPPWGIVLAHEGAHAIWAECGGPEMFTGGARLRGLPGGDGKIDPVAVTAAAARSRASGFHEGQPTTLSLTQVNELGGVYAIAEVEALCRVAGEAGLAVHMDGARFANAVAALGCHPAEVTWRAGVKALSFGGTKNGCLMAEAVVIFEPTPAERTALAFRRKQAGQVLSKHRVLALQFDAYLADGLWLRHAAHANAMAARLAAGLARVPSIRLLHPVEANQLFLALPVAVHERLAAAGYRLSAWDEGVWRAVTAFDTPVEAVDGLLDCLAAAVGEAAA